MIRTLLLCAACAPALPEVQDPPDTAAAVLEWDDGGVVEPVIVETACVVRAVTPGGAELSSAVARVPGWARGVEARIDGEPVPWRWLGEVLVAVDCAPPAVVAWTWLP